MQARALPSRTFPQVFLHHMMGMCASWQLPQRLLVHTCLITLLPVATDGLKDTQLHGLLSTIWHEVSHFSSLFLCNLLGLCMLLTLSASYVCLT